MTGWRRPASFRPPRRATSPIMRRVSASSARFGSAFVYTGAVVDEARVVVLNAVDAAERGASIRTGARCVRADREEEWRLGVIDRGHRRTITARALVNATGAWTNMTAETVLRRAVPRARLLRESRIVVRRPFDHDWHLRLPPYRRPADLRQPVC